MAYQFLHRPHGRTPHDQVRAERVTQDMNPGWHIRPVGNVVAMPGDHPPTSYSARKIVAG